MFERRISVEEVRTVIVQGEVIQAYPDDKPYPSQLLLGWIGSRPLHVVVADDSEDGILIVVTAYEPDPIQWDSEFKTKVL
jgi:hypothetical protein